VLASVLLITGYKLAKPDLFKKMWTYGPEQFVPFVVTVTGVVFTDLLTGVGLGLCAAIMFLLQRNYRNSHFLHKNELPSEESRPVVSLKLAEEVTFLNKAAIKKELHAVKDNSRVIIDKRNCVYINHDVSEIISEFVDTAGSRGITVEFIEREPTSMPKGINNTVAIA
jgi:MFS superfamily sulfate permease-like transporter